MKVIETNFKGLVILEPAAYHDSRGFFMEAFNVQALNKSGIETTFVQDNQSYSRRNVIRGLHYQRLPFAQAKLVRVLAGAILDVVVDIRKNEPTYLKHFCIELSAENRKQIFVPKGFAHGFLVKGEDAMILYKTDEYYHVEAEGGLLYNDPLLAIDWGISDEDAVVSDKDLLLPSSKDLKSDF